MKHSLLLSLLLFVCLGVFGQSSSVPTQKVTLDQLQTTVNSQQSTITTLQDSIQSLRADNADLRKQLDRMEKNMEEYKWYFGQTVDDYNDKINHWLAIFSIIAAILAIAIPYINYSRLKEKIEEVKKQAKYVEENKDKVESIKEDVEKNANEANAPNFYKIGLSKYEEGKPGEALENIERAISLKKDYPEAIFLHGLLKYETKGVDEALSDINNAIAKNPYFADAIYIKSLLEFEKGNAVEAVGDINYAKKLKKDVIESYPIRTHLKGRMKALDNAIHYCEYSDDMNTLIGLIKTEKSKELKPKYLSDGLSSISIEIPNSVTVIGERAFFICKNLSSIVISSSVTKIGDYTFIECTRLTLIKIPNSVTEIGKGAFLGCTSLTSIEIPVTSKFKTVKFS